MDYKVVDNFLDKESFNKIQESILYSDTFPWYLSRHITSPHLLEANDGYCFNHVFYWDCLPNSDYFKLLLPLLELIDYFALKRIKANFYPKTDNIEYHNYHVDSHISHKGLLFYLNTNDGFTILEDGTKIESIENRALFFDPSVLHKSTSCTDDSVGRFNLIFNYI